MKRFFKVKYTNVPFLGYLNAQCELMKERILHVVVTSTLEIPLQLLKRGDIMEAVDTLWAPSEHSHMVRFRTSQGILVCIPYAKMDDLLEEVVV